MLDRFYLMSNRYERVLNTIPWTDPIIRSIFSGISRVTRLSYKAANQHHQVIWNTAANVIAPLYVSFVWWLLQQAKAAGIRRLYFMARDGLILKEIADILVPACGLDIETRYIYVSRQSLLYPSIINVDAFDVRWLTWNPLTDLSMRTILQRLGISSNLIEKELKNYEIEDISRSLSLVEKWRLRKFFLEPRIKSLILERTQARYETAILYLKQEGLADGNPFALVDLGWAALSQYAISRMLDKAGCRPAQGLRGYYLGTNWLLWKYRNDTAESFLFNPSNLIRQMPLVQYELPEIFAVLDHGRTLGYEIQNNHAVPILSKPNTTAKEWGSDIQRSGVLTFAKEIVAVMPKHHWQKKSPSARIAKIFDLFCNRPSREEAETYGSFLHGADMEEKNPQEISPRVGLGSFFKTLKGYYWVQGSVIRSKWICPSLIVNVFVLLNVVRHGVIWFVDSLFYKRP